MPQMEVHVKYSHGRETRILKWMKAHHRQKAHLTLVMRKMEVIMHFKYDAVYNA